MTKKKTNIWKKVNKSISFGGESMGVWVKTTFLLETALLIEGKVIKLNVVYLRGT